MSRYGIVSLQRENRYVRSIAKAVGFRIIAA
jgi:hypothetical protein